MSSQEVSNSQTYQNIDFSDSSVEDLFSDLPDEFIEKLLNLEKPRDEFQATEKNDRLIVADKYEDDTTDSPTAAETIQSATESHFDLSNQSISSITDEKVDVESLKVDADVSELPNIEDSLMELTDLATPSASLEEVELGMDFMNEEKMGERQPKNTGFDVICEEFQNLETDERSSAFSTERSPLPPLVTRPYRQISLRARTKIQLKPFTLEASKFNEMIRHTSAKSKLNIIVSDDDDDSDTDFTPSNTQAVDEEMDDTLTYPDTQDILSGLSEVTNQNVKRNKGKERDNMINIPKKPPVTNAASSSGSSAIQKPTSVISEPSTKLSSLTSQTEGNVDDLFDYDKYGLSQLIIPPRRNKHTEKSKIITFSKKKGSSKNRSRSTSRVPPRFMEKSSNDIFDFDFNPKPNFNILQETLPTSRDDSQMRNSDTLSRNISNSIDSIEDHIEGYEAPPNSSQLASGYPTTINIDTDEDIVDDDDEEIPVFKSIRRKKVTIFDSDEEEETEERNDVEKEYSIGQVASEDEEMDSVFDFPSDMSEVSSNHLRISTDNDVIPIVQDEYEYKEAKRQRYTIQDLMRNPLRNVLPASFIKVNKNKIEEEARLNRKRKRKAVAKKSCLSSNSRQRIEKSSRETEDIFAVFREDSDQSDDGYENTDKGYVVSTEADPPPIFDDSFDFVEVDSTTPIDLTNERMHSYINLSNQPTANAQKVTLSSLANLNNENINATTEAIEDNRVARYYHVSRQSVVPPPRNISKSSIAIEKPRNAKIKNPNLIQIKQNPTPSKRRRRKLKRTRDDIYVHEPYYYSYRTGNSSNTNGNIINNSNINHQGMFVNDNFPRRPFDDIYMNTKRQLLYKNDLIFIGKYDVSDLLNQRSPEKIYQKSKPTIFTLKYVVKQVEKLVDCDLRRVIGLKNTLYVHHHLMQPLLSDKPNRSNVYSKFKDAYLELILFNNVYQWKNIHPKKGSLLIPLFARVFNDIKNMCNKDYNCKYLDQYAEIPGHDHFYVFVSICLTQWVPLYPYEDQLQLVEVFANQIRGLSTMIIKLVDGREFKSVPWRAILKVLMFSLDWTCRLHHLGVDKDFWSVSDCIKLLMDVLVYIGYDAVKNSSDPSHVFVTESWICILQILSASDKQAGGYFYNEHIFINQLTDSIKNKSRVKEVEYEKRKTTRLWAEALCLVLTKHMMLM